MIKSPHHADKEPSGLHAPTWFATEQEYMTVLYWAIVANGYKKILEIGTYMGHSTWWFVEAAKKTGGHVTTVDIRPSVFLKYDEALFKQVEKPSDEIWGEDKFDFIYVDGWHGYSQAHKDIVNAAAHLTPGGMIAVHDTGYNNGDVVQVREALKSAIPSIGGDWMFFDQGKGIAIGEF